MTAPIIRMTMDTKRVEASLRRKSLKGVKRMVLHVVYAMPYAVYVHEDLLANHPRGGQAKYLEEPARLHAQEIGDMVRTHVANKNGLEEGCRRAAERLLELSRPLVPVDTGALRDSGQIEVTEVARP